MSLQVSMKILWFAILFTYILRNNVVQKLSLWAYKYPWKYCDLLFCSPIYGGFLKWWYPQIIYFNRVFHYISSILRYPYFRKHPYIQFNHVWSPWMSRFFPLNSLNSCSEPPIHIISILLKKQKSGTSVDIDLTTSPIYLLGFHRKLNLT